MPGPRGPQGPKPKIKNPGKLFARLMGFIFKKYLPACNCCDMYLCQCTCKCAGNHVYQKFD